MKLYVPWDSALHFSNLQLVEIPKADEETSVCLLNMRQ